MKRLNHWIAALSVLVILLLIPIVLPIIDEDTASTADDGAGESPRTVLSNQLVFKLQYDQYLVPPPYRYEYNGEIRTFEFHLMMDAARLVKEELEKGQLTYISNYKDKNGKAPLYHGKTVDADGTLRGAAAPAYRSYASQEEFEYLPDGTLVRILENSSLEHPDFTKVYSIRDQVEYFVPDRYVELERGLEEVKKVIVVDLKNQTIAALENNSNSVFYEASNTIMKTDWEIVSYSKCTTGKLGTYHQPTPTGFFYAMEKKEFFYYLKDGTNIVGGSEPWAIRFTAGAYIHGMSSGDYSPSIGTVPLSHKCVRNYTSHARFLYDWYEADKTIVIVL